jgi:imidazoleglycerol-phosphate dehydratase
VRPRPRRQRAFPNSPPASASSTTCSTRSRATACSTSTVEAKGDLHIDDHHTVEDVGITLGQAFAKALGDKKGCAATAMPTCRSTRRLSRVVVDLSGRPGLVFNVPFTRATIGEFDVDLVREFFQGLVNHANITVHIDNLRGDNAHHQAETVFKAFARALRMAVEADPRAAGAIPSTKGSL